MSRTNFRCGVGIMIQRRTSCRLAVALVALGTSLLADERASTAATPSTIQTCGTSRVRVSNIGLPEIRGVATHGVKLWALLFYQPPAVAGKDLKIVVDMTSSGPPHILAIGPTGQAVQHEWIEQHTGSNWKRPGDEWGTGWNLPAVGCWRLHATRRNASGNIWLNVGQAPQ